MVVFVVTEAVVVVPIIVRSGISTTFFVFFVVVFVAFDDVVTQTGPGKALSASFSSGSFDKYGYQFCITEDSVLKNYMSSVRNDLRQDLVQL